MKKKQGCQLSGQEMTPNKSRSLPLRSNGLSPSKTSKQRKKSLLFSEVVSKEIKASVLERKNKMESIRRILSGKILRKYKLINLLMMQQQKQAVIAENCVDPSLRLLILKRTNVVSTRMFTCKSLNFMLGMKCLLPYLAKHHNVALKLKMLKTHNKTVPVNPALFIKNFSSDEIQKLLNTCKVTSYSYEEWQNVKVNIKTRSGEEKVKEKMKVVSKTKTKLDFETCFKKEILAFREHVKMIKNQFAVQRNLKENLPANHICIHMDFAEDYRCRSQEEIQSAYNTSGN